MKSKVLLEVLYSYFQIQRNVLFFRVRANLVFYLVPKKFPHTRLEKPNVLKENNFIMLTLKTQFCLFFTFLSNFIMLFSFCFSSFYALNKTPLGETRCLTNPNVFIGCSSIQFFISRPFSKTVN